MKSKKILTVLITITVCCNTYAQQFEYHTSKHAAVQSTSAMPQIDNYFHLGYCQEATFYENDGLGLRDQTQITALIKLPKEMIANFIGDKISALRIGFSGSLSNVKAVVKNELDGANIVSKTFNGTLGWNEVKLDKGIVIENKDYYIGYEALLPAGKYAISKTVTDATRNALWLSLPNRGFTDYTSNFGALAVEALLLGDDSHFSNLLTLSDINIEKYQPVNTITDIDLLLINKGINEIKSFEITYEYGSKGTKTQPFEVSILPNRLIKTIPLKNIHLDESGNIKVYLSKINGNSISGDAITKPIVVYEPSNVVPRKSVIEQFTTENCGYCPAGAIRIKNVINRAVNNDKVIWLAHHVGFGTDPFTVDESKQYLRLYGSGGTFAPAMMVDRMQYDNGDVVNSVGEEDYIQGLIDKAQKVPCFINITIKQNNSINDTEKKIQITVEGAYNGEVPTEELFVTVFLVENGVSAVRQNGAASGYKHNNLIRKILPAASGSMITWNNNKFSIDFSETFDTTWKVENMRIVTIVNQKHTNDLSKVAILNAQEAKLEPIGGNAIGEIDEKPFIVVAKDNQISIIDGNYLSFEIVDISGRAIPNKNIPAGIYLLKIVTHTKTVVTQKFIFKK